jgi:hypothetical protein
MCDASSSSRRDRIRVLVALFLGPLLSSGQAAVENKKCPRRNTMMIGCIDYFVDLLSMKVMKANVSGYFAFICAVV